MDVTDFKSVVELLDTFKDEQSCIEHLECLPWDGNVVSPFAPTSVVYKCKNNRYRCKNTGKYFNVKTNTLFIPNRRFGINYGLHTLYNPTTKIRRFPDNEKVFSIYNKQVYNTLLIID